MACFLVTFSALQCYQLIDDPETRDIADWTEDGAAFVVHNAKVPAATFCKLLQLSSLNCLSRRARLLLPYPEHHRWPCTSCTLHAKYTLHAAAGVQPAVPAHGVQPCQLFIICAPAQHLCKRLQHPVLMQHGIVPVSSLPLVGVYQAWSESHCILHVPAPVDKPGLLQGFKRVPNTKAQTYSHQYFKRGQRELLALMTRGGQKSSSDHLLLANFALKHKVGTVLHVWA